MRGEKEQSNQDCEIISNGLVCVSLEFQKRGRNWNRRIIWRNTSQECDKINDHPQPSDPIAQRTLTEINNKPHTNMQAWTHIYTWYLTFKVLKTNRKSWRRSEKKKRDFCSETSLYRSHVFLNIFVSETVIGCYSRLPIQYCLGNSLMI